MGVEYSNSCASGHGSQMEVKELILNGQIMIVPFRVENASLATIEIQHKRNRRRT